MPLKDGKQQSMAKCKYCLRPIPLAHRAAQAEENRTSFPLALLPHENAATKLRESGMGVGVDHDGIGLGMWTDVGQAARAL